MTARARAKQKPPVIPEAKVEGASTPREWRVEIPGFIPTSLNKLIGNHWKAARLKKSDARAIAKACTLCRVPPVGLSLTEKRARRKLEIKGRLAGDPEPRKRHIALEIKLGKGQRAADEDNYWKALLDGLKNAGMLFEDSRFWCSHDANIEFSRGENKWDRGTVILIREEA